MPEIWYSFRFSEFLPSFAMNEYMYKWMRKENSIGMCYKYFINSESNSVYVI